ncbi:MAG TPA: alpha-ribazole phosphatase, partial [Bacillota bacterium]|nr:alpha-ribazole phosphatase [Bacillota bacterium]
YLVRHGSTMMNEKGVYQGWTDAPLSETGKQQCEVVKAKLRQVSFDAIISSPLERAVRSAQIITGKNRDRIMTKEALKEFNFGVWEGLNHKEAAAQYPREWEAWCADWQHSGPPRGENFLNFYQRVEQGYHELLRSNGDETVLIVSHEGPLRVIATLLLTLKPEDYWRLSFEFGCYSMFEVTQAIPVMRKINA